MKKPIYVVDSFSEKPLAGNPAGVLLDGADLDAKEMQRIAAEMRHSETAFPLPAQDPAASFHLRWFTPTAEVVFCGHATLAAVQVLVEEARRLRVPDSGVTRSSFTCKAGLLRLELSRDEKRKLKIRIETPRTRFEKVQIKEELLAALGIAPESLDPKVAAYASAESAVAEGNVYLALRDREALARVKPDPRALAAAAKAMGRGGVVLYTLFPKQGTDAALRCFFPAYGVDEDPVTGSASGELAALIQQVLPEEMPRKLSFTQGEEVGRPGRVEIEVRPEAEPGHIRSWIGGAATVLLRGELDLPAVRR